MVNLVVIVIAINLLYTTLEESSPDNAGTLLQIPNALIFQRVVRRWKGGLPPPPPEASAPLSDAANAEAGPLPAAKPLCQP